MGVVKELDLSYFIGEAILITTDTHYGNLTLDAKPYTMFLQPLRTPSKRTHYGNLIEVP